jgi:hypothetical protein
MKNARLKPDFIATARAFRRHTDRMFAYICAGKKDKLLQVRRNRLYRAYLAHLES